jgi:hypothetical protein
MTRNKKILIAVGIIATVGIGYILYAKLVKPSWVFKDNHWQNTTTNKLGFIGVTKPPFKVHDKIKIIQSAGFTHASYNGETTITAITKVGEEWVVSVPKGYKGSTPVNGGVIVAI